MPPRISVIVPIYNVEPYLARCLASLQAQTFQDFEVLLVNDGTTDSSAVIAERFIAERHAVGDRRFRLLSKQNGGLSSARNFGMDAAQGEYLAFVDSDDTVEPAFLATLFALAEKHQADMVICGINDVYGEGSQVFTKFPRMEPFACSGEEALRMTLEGTPVVGSVCCRLVRFSRCGATRFPEGLNYEDIHFVTALTPHLRSVVVSTAPLYSYYHRPDSITTECFNPRTLDILAVYGFVEQTVREQYGEHPDILTALRFRILWAHFVVIDRMLATPGYRQLPDFLSVLRYLRAHTAEVLGNPHFASTRKLAARVLALSVAAYRLLMRAQQRRLTSGAR